MEKSIFETKEQYFVFVKQWKEAANKEDGAKLSLQHFILYALLRGKDWRRSLAVNSKESTLSDVEYWTKECDPKHLSLWPFGDTVTGEMILQARVLYAEGV